MPYCGQCGVEVENGVKACPLCAFEIPVLAQVAEGEAAYPASRLPIDAPAGRRRRATWLGLSFCILASFLIVLASDLVRNGEITWSRYALSSLGLLWLLASWMLLLFRHVWLVYLCSFASVVGFLALIDVCHEGLFWFLRLGLPIAAMVFAMGGLLHLFARKTRVRGAMLIGVFFLLLIVFCFGLELLLSGFLGAVALSWSFIVLSIAGPLAVFLFYYHARLSPQIDLKRLFHV